MIAVVYKSTGSWYTVKTHDGTTLQARIKGIFKIDGITSTNPVAVGDEVELEMEESGTAVISGILPRKNYIARASPHLNRDRHIVASNLDQALVFATITAPRTSQGFIDRFLVSAEAYHIPAIIVFNKCDIYRAKEWAILETRSAMYRQIGYSIFVTSMQTGQGIEELTTALKGKSTLISGHSGTGKSTFINSIFPDLNLKTKDISGWSGKGMHTTTFAEMFDLPFGGTIIDTPGIREFGLTDISRQELSHYFPEMRNLLTGCQFNNCIHINEPGCAIKKAVEEGNIAEERYLSYYNMLESIDDKSY